jgi:arylsulfatase A-like enzyme
MLGRAMIEAMDTEIGRVLRVTEEVAPNTIVIFLGDNGTAATLVRPPFVADRAKGTVYEGGVNVPLVVRGPGIPVGECEALVHVVDLFATISELGGNPSSSEDSISIVPYFTDPLQPSLREFVYSEWFSPNGPPPYATHERCVREERYKLIRQLGAPDEFYDLDVDPMEWNDLMPHLTSEQQAAYDRLAAELLRLGVD